MEITNGTAAGSGEENSMCNFNLGFGESILSAAGSNR